MIPYADSLEHLLDEFSRIDRLIRSYFEVFRAELSEPIDEFRGLYISEAEIQTLMKSPGFGTDLKMLPDSGIKETGEARRDINSRKIESLRHGKELRLHTLSELFSLDPFEIDILLIGLAPELDLKYEKIYSYLQNDVTRKRPGVDLALNLLCPTTEVKIKARAYFSRESPLVKNHLVYLEGKETGENSEGQQSLLSTALKVDERIVNFLLEFDEPDQRIRDFSYIIEPKRSFGALVLPEDLKSRLKDSISWHIRNKVPLKFFFEGPDGSGKKITAEAACREVGTDLLIVDSKALLESRFPEIVTLVLRESLLQDSALYLENFNSLLANTGTEIKETKISLKNLLHNLRNFPKGVFLAGNGFFEQKEDLINSGFLSFSFPCPSYLLRKKLWEACLEEDHTLAKDTDLKELASKFRFTGGQIEKAITTAREIARAKNPDIPTLSTEILYESCKARSNQRLSGLTMKINPHYNWEDIVLPKDTLEQLKEICDFVKYRGTVYSDWGFEKKLSLGKGLNVLFSGPSGTGKTMAAEVLACEVQLDIYKIDLSSIVSKYIGETEKNLNKIFKEAEMSNAILFFDEADALFGKRSEVKDAHDRYANIETAYLLQKMEEHEGTVILASNFRKNMDDAFLRRLHFTVEFQVPDEKSRELIWKNTFPAETPLEAEVDFAFLSKFKLTGGNIKNIALSASFLAAGGSGKVGMEHIIRATKREYQKIGKLFTETDFGEYSRHLK
ncbi:AAA family ATPase [Methanosarcina sp.]|uniref:AAA family ATPase n=1 Tax=Methanosarcina sp. TaxID=2213 RepID=UPI002ABCABC6|nr:AAA family ATPase [Methanosarcina sp.]MDY9927106.1 AAA family ATPase [Methanosarcina sp.]